MPKTMPPINWLRAVFCVDDRAAIERADPAADLDGAQDRCRCAPRKTAPRTRAARNAPRPRRVYRRWSPRRMARRARAISSATRISPPGPRTTPSDSVPLTATLPRGAAVRSGQREDLVAHLRRGIAHRRQHTRRWSSIRPTPARAATGCRRVPPAPARSAGRAHRPPPEPSSYTCRCRYPACRSAPARCRRVPGATDAAAGIRLVGIGRCRHPHPNQHAPVAHRTRLRATGSSSQTRRPPAGSRPSGPCWRTVCRSWHRSRA